ncbi:MAG: prepilin-type N-terminal cleavage/methylation domain-containing protein [Gemmatimonadota bacterium]
MHQQQLEVPTTPRRGGFSMVEVIIAIVILAAGVLGLAGTTAYIVRQVTLADLMTERAAALQSTIDRLQAMDFDSVSAGTDSVGVFRVRWTSVNETSQSKLVAIITYGPGLSSSGANPFPVMVPNVADTFNYRVIKP